MTSAHNSNDNRIFQKECVSIAKDPAFDVFLVAPGQSREEKNVKVVGIGEKPQGRLKRMFGFSNLVYRQALKTDADIYHFHDPELLHYGIKLKKRGKIVIFDSHENTAEQIKIKNYIPSAIRKMIAYFYKAYETHVCKRIDAVIFPCLFNKKDPFENRSKQTVFVNNVPYLSEFADIKKEKSIYDVCVIGSLTEERGITNLLKACKAAGAKVALGGIFSPESYKSEMYDRGLMENVDYLGFCERSKVAEMYAHSRIGVSTLLPIGQYPSADNLPTKVYEYMAMKMPVVISNFEYPVEVMGTYKFGICVNPENPEEIADAIRLLMQSPQDCQKMGDEGRRAIEEVFNWENESKKIRNLYIETYEKR